MSWCLEKIPNFCWHEIMLKDEKSIVSRLALCSTMYHICFQRNVSVNQGRLPSEQAMVKMIR